MNKFTHLGEFSGELVDDVPVLEKAQKVVMGILAAHSPRQSDIAREMSGSEAANYKCIRGKHLKETFQQLSQKSFGPSNQQYA